MFVAGRPFGGEGPVAQLAQGQADELAQPGVVLQQQHGLTLGGPDRRRDRLPARGLAGLGYAGGAHDAAAVVKYGRDLQGDVDQAAILARSHRLHPADGLALLDLGQDARHPIRPLRRYEEGDGGSRDLLLAVAVDALGALVPT